MKFTLALTPKAQMRPRFAKVGRAYKAKAQIIAEESLMAMLVPFKPEQPFDGPVSLRVQCFLPIPRSWSRKRKEQAREGILKHTSKPDLDNLIKQLKDCMTALQFWKDDRQVFAYLAPTGKRYDDGAGPRWEVEIAPWPDKDGEA